MDESPSTLLHLSKATYLEGKHAVVAEFSSDKIKKTFCFNFFPSLLVPKVVESKLLQQILSAYDSNKFLLKELRGCFEIIASSFSDAKCISNLISATLKTEPLLLSAERQFLLQSNWSYFDCFRFQDGKPKSLPLLALPKTELDFAAESLEKTLSELIQLDSKAAQGFSKAIALSNILVLPLHALPPHNFLQVKVFLENLFYKNKFSTNSQQKQMKQKSGFYRFIDLPPKFTELDFSCIWPALLTMPFYNLGFDSINCSCCSPASLTDPNVLPGSLVEVRFKQNAFYFESFSDDFACEFHEGNSCKESRLKRQREFFLQSIPVGPFNAGQTSFITLLDAQRLEEEQSIEIISGKKLHWFCLKQESFLSKAIKQLNKRLVMLEREIEAMNRRANSAYGILAASYLNKDADYFFLTVLRENLDELLKRIPAYLSNSSVFSSSDLPKAVKSVQLALIHSFMRFSQEQGSRFVHCSGRKGFVRSDAPLKLVKEFAEKAKTPAPAIVSKKKAYN